MLLDAIVLAGGRSSRLGSVPKGGLVYEQQTLVRRTVAAVSTARRTVVVGEVAGAPTPDGVLVTREDPPFGGPVAGIAAGLTTLAQAARVPSDHTVVLACDMPHVARATAALLEALPQHHDADGVIAVDHEGRLQPLAAVYRTAALTDAIERARQAGRLHGLPVFRLIAGMNLTPVAVPRGSTDDIDTWEDAAAFGIGAPSTRATEGEA